MKTFISYTTRDGVWTPLNLVDVAKSLEQVSPFVDAVHNDSIDIQSRIIREIESCDVFIGLVTEGFLQSPWVRGELKLAREYGKPVVMIESGPGQDMGAIADLVFEGIRSGTGVIYAPS